MSNYNTYNICTLFSGSSGNCVYVSGKRAKILIDAGKSAKAVREALKSIGVSINEIDAIFITHEHTDHISALKTLSKNYGIPVHAVTGCASCVASCCGCTEGHVIEHDPIYSVEVGDLSVSSFRTSHDSACSVGYKITTEDGRSFGIATDTGIVTKGTGNALTGCEAVVLECNYDPDMLRDGPYPQHLKTRIASRFGHLSNGDCARFASYLANYGTKSILLAHISRENNSPELALGVVREAVSDNEVTVKVASQNDPTFILGNTDDMLPEFMS